MVWDKYSNTKNVRQKIKYTPKPNYKLVSRGWSDSTVDRALALHVADPVPIPGTPYGPLRPEYKVSLSITGCEPKTKESPSPCCANVSMLGSARTLAEDGRSFFASEEATTPAQVALSILACRTTGGRVLKIIVLEFESFYI